MKTIKKLKKTISEQLKSASNVASMSTYTLAPNQTQSYMYESTTSGTWRGEQIEELLSDYDPEYENLTISNILNTHGWKINLPTVPYIGYLKQDIERAVWLAKDPTIHGNCMTFNTAAVEASADFANKNQDFRQKTGGSSNGLKMILNIQQDYYTDAVREEEDHSDLPFANSIAGVKVFIHDKNELLPMYESGIDVGPGSHASIGMVKNEFTNMWKPWGDCDYKQSVMEDGSFEDIFTINTCLQICYSAFIDRTNKRKSL